MTATARRKAPAPWQSGFCGLTNGPASHARCAGGYDADHPCICPCHQETTVIEIQALSGEVIAVVPEQPVPDLSAIIDSLTRAAEAVGESTRAAHLTKIDWQDAVRMLDRIRAATDLIGAARDALALHAYITGEHGDVEVDGVKGTVKIARGRTRKDWRVEDTARSVVDAKMEALKGEQPDPLEVVDWLLSVLHVDYARVTPLRALGLDPKEFCTDVPGRPGVSLPPR